MRITDKQRRTTFDIDTYYSYNTDWTTRRRYVHPTHGLRLWEGGIVDLIHSGDNDPSLRERLSDEYGIHILMRNELPANLVTEKGGKVAKSWLEPRFFLHDEESGRFFALDSGPDRRLANLEYRVRWPCVGGFPHASNPVYIQRPNKAREKEWYTLNADFLLRARAVAALSDRRVVPDDYSVKRILRSVSPTERDLLLLGEAAKNERNFRKLVLSITNDSLFTRFLRIA